VHEQRRVACLEAREQVSAAVKARPAGERPGRQRDADGAGIEQCVDIAGQRRTQRDSSPDAEPAAELEQPAVVGLQQRLGLVPRQRLDPERTRDRQQRSVDTVALEQIQPRVGVVLAMVKRRLGLIAQAQHPAAAAAAQQRRLTTPGQRGDEALWPEVLVDVDARHGAHNIHKPYQVCRDYVVRRCQVAQGRARGWPDDGRAIALYASYGFEVEGPTASATAARSARYARRC
jgi:hypothetical protein